MCQMRWPGDHVYPYLGLASSIDHDSKALPLATYCLIVQTAKMQQRLIGSENFRF